MYHAQINELRKVLSLMRNRDIVDMGWSLTPKCPQRYKENVYRLTKREQQAAVFWSLKDWDDYVRRQETFVEDNW